ncbi:MAG: molybdenum cofactor guanylyltransferase [Lachnospiraceae bacterium]|nr:molybdenum cofactor guanylyltransferase [Lachnospiraceae bacterium]
MGRDKVLLADKAGRTLLTHFKEELSPFDEVLVSSNVLEDAVPDLFPGCGPMAGIHAALLRCRNEYLFCIPCDMPLFPGAAALRMLEAFDTEKDRALTVCSADGRIHPVCCIVSKTLLPLLERKLRDGDFRLQAFFREAGARIIELPDFPDDIFMNMNTPEDYEKYLHRDR